tara:strand:+ start:1061 stop:1624 length:564 start_codon:yes stop_codon:yes gene_type:complete
MNKTPNNVDDIMFILDKVIKFTDTNNRSNTRKKIKKGLENKIDILTQASLIIYDSLLNKSVIEVKSPENLEIQRENIRLLKRVNELEDIENKYNINLRRSREMREEIDELKNKIQTQINNIPTKPPPNYKPSTFDEELSSSEDDDIDYYEDNEDIKDVLKKKSIKRPDTSSEEEEDDIIKNLNKGLF